MGRKKIKKPKKIKDLKIKLKKNKTDKKVKAVQKTSNLEEKIEIKKIKKQPTEKKSTILMIMSSILNMELEK